MISLAIYGIILVQFKQSSEQETGNMKIHKQDNEYTYCGTEKRNTKISTDLLDKLNNPTMLPYPNSTWKHDKHNGIMLSTGNSKINSFAETMSTKAVAYGKSTILSCPFAANCVKFCYQNLNNYTASARMHGHNYYMIYGQTVKSIVSRIQYAIAILPKNTTIVRINDNGDFMSLQEILAWLTIATDNPHIIFYGYTKNTPHLYKARIQFGQFPSNFRINISDMNENDVTMEKYMRQLLSEFPGEFTICHIIDTEKRDDLYQNLPWNDGEKLAYQNSQDFKIALHVGVAQRQFCNDTELAVNDKYDGIDGVC